MKRIILSVVVVVAMLFAMMTVFSACGRNHLVGVWESDYNNFSQTEFLSDGMFMVWHFGIDGWNERTVGTWTTNGDRLILTDDSDYKQRFTFDISRNTLTLIEDWWPDWWPDEMKTHTRVRPPNRSSSYLAGHNLLGVWDYDGLKQIEFKYDGTFIERTLMNPFFELAGIELAYDQWVYEREAAWTADGNRLLIYRTSWHRWSYTFNVSGDKLTFTGYCCCGDVSQVWTRIR